jgi:hypothetical protein
VAELEQTRHLQAGQIDGLRHTVDELTRKLAEAEAAERRGLVADQMKGPSPIRNAGDNAVVHNACSGL